MTNTVFFHTIRQQYEATTNEQLMLQDLGLLTEDDYFNNDGHEDCVITVGNDCNTYVNLPRELVGFEDGYTI